jgi:hypothetical protein
MTVAVAVAVNVRLTMYHHFGELEGKSRTGSFSSCLGPPAQRVGPAAAAEERVWDWLFIFLQDALLKYLKYPVTVTVTVTVGCSLSLRMRC